ncbi:hypothetical protein PIROE2DRAFT_65088 [Piromyces sp. E2]|nr:hypothetical protein PIROE2DRAFT_65088 [Piromyces sp. E2]|eukprot:OUM57287.1 hypothetical protein PIROE2DRAFT_65088 [Piromyces sp. E2]
MNRGNPPPEPYYEDCSITLEDTDGSKLLNGVKGKVKVRGNWTSNYPKKGLRISFEESQSLLGLNNGGKFKSWVLLAEYKDGSMLRNKSVFQYSRDILGADGYYSSDSTLVELRINDEYFGVYLLAEQQQINKGRVNINKCEDNYTGTDIGYFLEYDNGYSIYEDKIQSFVVNFNDNAPLKPYDGNGGSGKTITPKGSFGGMGNWGNFPGMGGGNFPGMGGQGGQDQPGQPGGNWQQPGQGQPGGNWQQPGQGQRPGNNWQQPGQQNNNGQGNQWGGFGNWGNTNTNNNNLRKRQFMMGGNGENMTIKNDVYSQEQHDFIANYINNAYNIMYEAAYNKNPLKFTSDYTSVVEAPELTPRQAIENVVEAESLADMFIISEIACDADLYYSSFYLDVDFSSKGSKKLRFEAPWDFDSAVGNRERCTDGKGHFAGNITPDNGMGGQQINPWLAVLMYEDWYQDLIRSRWSKAYDNGVFGRVVDMIHTDTQVAAQAFNRNYEKWDNIKNNSQFANELSQGAKQCKTQSEAANFLAKWFEARIAFINSHWHK